ncbi:MAG: isoleucine--tRNA ligase [Chloroflexi bacterium]|nr:isoleucine--tRNA ligase [Chloroflexota bacterium]MYK62359.1 isoleucine--tRNA ligase [Chloroflexota bacterium]
MTQTTELPDTAQSSSFDPVLPEAEVDFVEIETQWLERWNTPNADGQTIIDRYLTRNNEAEKNYSFIDGPITANNPMGVHHAWGRTYKDLFLRFRNMQGYRQRFQNGYDGQGLWIEVEVEKEKGFKSKHEIETYGVDKFVTECKARVDHFSDIITRQSKRLGYFMQWDDSYHTKSDENNYTIWAFLKRCHDNGWLYKGKDVMPWCPRCGTGMSQHEIATEGYAEIVHPGFFIRLPLLDRDGEALLVWTTTPWTLAANVAAAVNPENDYVKVRNTVGDVSLTLWLSANRLHVLDGKHEVLEHAKGTHLVGWRYRGPFDDLEAQSEAREQHRVIEWEDVGDEEGTGIVHIAPGAGSEDFQLGKENDLPVIAPLDESGVYVDGFGVLSGKSVDEVNPIIFDLLRDSGVYYKLEDYEHRYPVCWRCSSELVFRLVDEWFISMDELRHTMMDATRTIKWVPAFGEARELDWLRNMQDWMISKKRYYGLALPIYECTDCPNFDVIGSRDELRARAVEGWDEYDGHSPHRPWIDAIKIKCSKCDDPIERIADVGNAWLDAGIVSFSTLAYNNDRDYWRDWFPADWISESFPGQFRNWFYSLICMSAALEGVAPTRAVFSYGLMRDENGEEMHKSKGNAIPFEEAADKMGADVMRWIFARHIPQNNLNFGYGVGDAARRRFVLPLWNIYYFFTTYARLDGWMPAPHSDTTNRHSGESRNPEERGNRALVELDRWAISELNALVRSVTEDLENWRIERASEAIETYVERLSNWYVRRSRRRFWKSEDDNDKQDAYNTLYTCLTTLSRLIAPIMPFISEEIYTNLVSRRCDYAPQSVHLADWPTADERVIDNALALRTNLAMRLASLGRSARSAARIKVRQPLNALIVELNSPQEREALPMIADQLKEELNVRDVRDTSESDSLMAYRLRPNLPALGPKYGRQVNEIRNLLNEADAAVVAATVRSNGIVNLGEFELNPDEILVDNVAAEGYAVESDGTYTVGIATEVSPELRAEGYVRDIAHIVQNMRKNAGLEISDRIHLTINAPEGSDVATAIANHTDYIANETLAIGINGEIADEVARDRHSVDGVEVEIALAKSTV